MTHNFANFLSEVWISVGDEVGRRMLAFENEHHRDISVLTRLLSPFLKKMSINKR